jgi:hypothetical protein
MIKSAHDLIFPPPPLAAAAAASSSSSHPSLFPPLLNTPKTGGPRRPRPGPRPAPQEAPQRHKAVVNQAVRGREGPAAGPGVRPRGRHVEVGAGGRAVRQGDRSVAGGDRGGQEEVRQIYRYKYIDISVDIDM